MKKEQLKEFNFNILSVEIIDLNGTKIDVPVLPSTLGNLIYVNMPTLDFLEIARKIHSSEIVELSIDQIHDLISFLKSDRCTIVAFIRHAIIKHLEHLNSNKSL